METTAAPAKRTLDPTTVGFMSMKQTTETIRQILTPEEIMQMQSQNTSAMITLKKLNANKKAYMKKYNEQVKAIKEASDITLEHVDNGYIERAISVYNVADEDRKVIEFYSVDHHDWTPAGVQVGERMMFADERTSIKLS